MNTFDDPQFCVISKGGYLTGLGSANKGSPSPLQTTNCVVLKLRFSNHVHRQWDIGHCLVYMRRQLGHNQEEKNKFPSGMQHV